MGTTKPPAQRKKHRPTSEARHDAHAAYDVSDGDTDKGPPMAPPSRD